MFRTNKILFLAKKHVPLANKLTCQIKDRIIKKKKKNVPI